MLEQYNKKSPELDTRFSQLDFSLTCYLTLDKSHDPSNLSFFFGKVRANPIHDWFQLLYPACYLD